jgi:hypothetical protein
MMHCGPRSEMLALAPGKVPASLPSTATRTTPKRRAINFPTEPAEKIAAPRESLIAPSNGPTATASRVVVAAAPAEMASAKATSLQQAPSEQKPSNEYLLTLYMVTALGDNHSVMTQLATLGDKDYRLLKNSDYKHRISLGIFGKTDNALRRQQALATQGIASELIERRYKRSVPQPQIPQEKQMPQEKLEKLEKLEKQEPQQTIAYMVRALGDNPTVMAQLAALQDEDYALLKSQNYTSRISLGIFNQMPNAKRRQHSLATLGILSELVEHRRGRLARPQIAVRH